MAFSSVDGKVAIVTGAGSGINLCFAELLLSKGCSVLFADISLRPEAQKVVEAYRPDSNSKAKAVFQKTDVRIWAELNKMFEVCNSELGPADIVCPGAGVFEPEWSHFWVPPGTQPSRDSPAGDRYASLDILLTHPVRTTQLAISHFIKNQKPGNIVHVSSIAAQTPSIVAVLYRTAKAAVSQFVRSLAQLENPQDSRIPRIRVTAVAPGIVITPLWDQANKEGWVDMTRDKWVTPQIVAGIMLELILKDEYVGGTVLEIVQDRVRKVEVLNDPGPAYMAGGARLGIDYKAEIWDKLASGTWGQTTTN